jgi:hypothetical protein
MHVTYILLYVCEWFGQNNICFHEKEGDKNLTKCYVKPRIKDMTVWLTHRLILLIIQGLRAAPIMYARVYTPSHPSLKGLVDLAKARGVPT